MSRISSVLILFPILLSGRSAAQDPHQIQVETIPLRANVTMLATKVGGNLAVCAGADGVLLVDAEYEQLTEKVKAAIAEISDRPVEYVFNTHWHFDHVGGNESFAASGSRIIAHENVRKRMAAGQLITIIDAEVPASPEEALPVITYTDRITFHLNGEVITATHIPNAHTDGDAIVHFANANVVHTGDIVFNRGYPFIDLSSGGSIDGMINAVERILELCNDETKIIPGHGPLSHKGELEGYGAMLREFRDIIAREIAAGRTLEEIQAAKPTASLDEKWGSGAFPPDTFTEIVYRSLTER
jgi:glyoxylase-like metal-dependent hydrolase (beta-lactamase superfamily II)